MSTIFRLLLIEMFVDHKHVLFCIIQKRKKEDMPIHICLVFIFADYRADFSFNSDIWTGRGSKSSPNFRLISFCF